MPQLVQSVQRVKPVPPRARTKSSTVLLGPTPLESRRRVPCALKGSSALTSPQTQRLSVQVVTTAKEDAMLASSVPLGSAVRQFTMITRSHAHQERSQRLVQRLVPSAPLVKSVQVMTKQAHRVLMASTAWLVKQPAPPAQQAISVRRRTSNPSYVQLGNTVRLRPLFVLTVISVMPALKEAHVRIHQQLCVNLATSVLMVKPKQSVLLEHMVTPEA